MSYLHPYSNFFFHPSFRLMFLTCLVFLFPSRTAASTTAQALDTPGSGNVDLDFPVFNATTFTCSGVPHIVGYVPCKYDIGGTLSLLPPKYNYLFPNQSARMMYKDSIEFNTPSNQVSVNFSTFFIFQISSVPNHSTLGAGIAFIIAPTTDTPDGSEGGGLGLYLNNTPGRVIFPQVLAVEFDTSFTEGIDMEGIGVPHIGFDAGVIASVNEVEVGSEFLNVPVGMWIDYDDNATTLEIFCTPVQGKTDATAASLKPTSPLFTTEDFDLMGTTADFKRMYIGFSAGIDNGGWEYNTIFYWRFTVTGYPPPAPFLSWYVWYENLPTSGKVAVIVGSLFGTIAGAYGCSECCFFLLCKRVKKPKTSEEKLFPYHWRTTLPGTRTKKQPPPRSTVRDSLSVTSPLYLWEAPAEPEWKPDAQCPETDASHDVQVPLIINIPRSDVEESDQQESKVDRTNEVIFGKSPDTDTPTQVAREEVEPKPQELDHSSKPPVREAVRQPGERPSEVGKKSSATTQRTVPAPAAKEIKPLPTETSAAPPVVATQQESEKKPERETKTGFEGEKRAALLIQKKLVQAPEKKPEPGTKTGLDGQKKTTQFIAKKPVQAGTGPDPIKSPRLVPPATLKVPAEVEKGPSPAGKAISPRLGKPASPRMQRPRLSPARGEVSPVGKTASPRMQKSGLSPARGAVSPAGKTASPRMQKPGPGTKTGLEEKQKAALLIERKPVQAVEKKPEPGTKTTQFIVKKHVQMGTGPAPIKSPRLVPPATRKILAQAEKGPSPARKALSAVGKTASPRMQKPFPSEKKVTFEAAKPILPAQAVQPSSPPKQRLLPEGQKASPLDGQPSSPPKQK